MQHDDTHVAFIPGEACAITIDCINQQLTHRKRRDVMAGGMMCCQGHRIVPVICKSRQSHFRHVNQHNNGGTVTRNVSACSCSKSKVHLEAQQLLHDHDYSTPIRFVQWYSCGIHYSTVFEATVDEYPVLEVTEQSRDGSRHFRTDIAYRNRSDDEICRRIEIWHRHRTGIDGARTDIDFLEADASHVKQKMLLKDYTIRVEFVHAKECHICAKNKRLVEEEREKRRREEFERHLAEEENRLAAEGLAEEKLRREVAEKEERLAAKRLAEEERLKKAAEMDESRRQRIEKARQQRLLTAKEAALKRKETKRNTEEANTAKARRIADDAMMRHHCEEEQLESIDPDSIEGKRMLRWHNELIALHNKKSKYKYEMRLAQITVLCPYFVDRFWNIDADFVICLRIRKSAFTIFKGVQENCNQSFTSKK